MFVNKRPNVLRGHMRTLQALLPQVPSFTHAALALFITCSVLFPPASLLHAETPAPGGLLTGTELMIEQMIRQMDGTEPLASSSASTELEGEGSPFLACIPNIRPVNGSVTSEFGYRKHPIYKSRMFHTGVDFAASEGSRVEATGNGTVIFSGYEKGYGQKVVINHGFGFMTAYAHLSKSLVRQGQKIRRGEVIALSGNTGISTGPHLHYEVYKDRVRVDPAAYFFDASNPDRFITIQQPSEDGPDSNS
ncbi:MAG: hypothetical protein A3K90_07840 [Pelodictyon luteolum]|uniref:M23ase beta-sheet core domain-containing protein n=2 Tax=Pelodictyon luteolum TaxID=1100 RepID=A0A165LJD5_PELLU|nr:MAG: hypothetical protein A3K90_07840 [Pelodictyon luteolum]